MSDFKITGGVDKSLIQGVLNLGEANITAAAQTAALDTALQGLNKAPNVQKTVTVTTSGMDALVQAARSYAEAQLRVNESLVSFGQSASRPGKQKDEIVNTFRGMTTAGREVIVTQRSIGETLKTQRINYTEVATAATAATTGLTSLADAFTQVTVAAGKTAKTGSFNEITNRYFNPAYQSGRVERSLNPQQGITGPSRELFERQKALQAEEKRLEEFRRESAKLVGKDYQNEPGTFQGPSKALFERQKQQLELIRQAQEAHRLATAEAIKNEAAQARALQAKLNLQKQYAAGLQAVSEEYYAKSDKFNVGFANREQVGPAYHGKPITSENIKAVREAIVIRKEYDRELLKSTAKEQMALNKSAAAWRFWMRFAVAQTVHRAIYALIRQIRDGIKATADLEKRISEIRTISQDRQLPFEAWFKGAKQLSDQFGTTLEDTIEGAYQAISNQIAKGGDAFIFMEEALQFSRAAVTDTATSVSLLTGALNSYNLTATHSEEVSATLFKMIELGRVRADEVSDSFGRVGVIANQLGVDLDEVAASIALLTIQGKKPAVVMTELRNIMLKLVKPTESLKELFREWGIESGVQAIATFGYTGVLEKLNDKFLQLEAEGVGKGVAKFNEYFNSIRAISGIMGLAGKNAGEFQKTLAGFNNKIADYNKAQNIAVESIGKQLQIQANQVRNYFVSAIGRDTLTAVSMLNNAMSSNVKIVDGMRTSQGTLLTTTQKLLNIMKGIVGVYISYRIALSIITAQESVLIGIMVGKQKAYMAEISLLTAKADTAAMAGSMELASTLRNTAALKLQQVELANLKIAYGLATAGITLALTAIAYVLYKQAQYVKDVSLEYARLVSNVKDASTVADEYSKKQDEINKSTKAQIDAIEEQNRAFARMGTVVRAALNIEIDDLTKKVKRSQEYVKAFLDSVISNLESRIKYIDENIKTLVDRLKQSEQIVKGIAAGDMNMSFFDTMLTNIGKVDEAWDKARANVITYQETLKAGKTDFLYAKEGAEPTEIQRFARSFELFKSFRKVLEASFREAIDTGEIERAREIFGRLLSDTDKLREFGYSYNEVLRIRTSLLEQYQGIEAKLRAEDQRKLDLAQKLKEQETQRLELVKLLYDELNRIEFTQKDFDSQLLDYNSIVDKIKGAIENADSPEIVAQLQAITTDKKSLAQTQLLIGKFDELSTQSTNAVNKAAALVNTTLDYIARLIAAQNKLVELDAQVAKKQAETEKITEQIQAKADIQNQINAQRQALEEALADALSKAPSGTLSNVIPGSEMYTYLPANQVPQPDIIIEEIIARIAKDIFNQSEQLQRANLAELTALKNRPELKRNEIKAIDAIIEQLSKIYAQPAAEQKLLKESGLIDLEKSQDELKDSIDSLIDQMASQNAVLKPDYTDMGLQGVPGLTGGSRTSGTVQTQLNPEAQQRIKDATERLAELTKALKDNTASTTGAKTEVSKTNQTLTEMFKKETETRERKTKLPGLGRDDDKDPFGGFRAGKLPEFASSFDNILDKMSRFANRKTVSTADSVPGFIGTVEGRPSAELDRLYNDMRLLTTEWEKDLFGDDADEKRNRESRKRLQDRIRELEEGVSTVPSASDWKRGLNRKTITPSTPYLGRAVPPITNLSVPDLNNYITVTLDGKELEAAITERQERGAKRGQNDQQIKRSNKNPVGTLK